MEGGTSSGIVETHGRRLEEIISSQIRPVYPPRGFGLWVRVRVLGSDNHNRFPNPNVNHNSNRNLTLTPILTPNSS